MNNKSEYQRRHRLRFLLIILCSIALIITAWLILKRNMTLSGYSPYSLGESSISINPEKQTLIVSKDHLMSEYDFSGKQLRTFTQTNPSFSLSPDYLLFDEEKSEGSPELTFEVGGPYIGTAVKHGILDTNTGNVIIEPKFFNYKTPSEGLIPVQYHSEKNNVITLGKWGYLDMQGREISGPSFDYAGEFKNGIAEVGIIVATKQAPVGKYIEFDVFCVDHEMNRISNPVIANTEGISLKKRYLSGYITDGNFWNEEMYPPTEYWFETAQGKLLGGQTFDEARPFQDGYAAVCRNKLWGIIDSSGKLVVDFRYEKIGEFSEGYATVWGDSLKAKEGASELSVMKKQGDAGKISVNGDIILPCRFDEVYETREGHFAVYKGGRPYLLSADGKIVLKPSRFGTERSFLSPLLKRIPFLFHTSSEEISPPVLQDGHIIFENGRHRRGVMNLQGEAVIPPVFEAITYLGEGKYLALSDFQNPFEVIIDTQNRVWKDGRVHSPSK